MFSNKTSLNKGGRLILRSTFLRLNLVYGEYLTKSEADIINLWFTGTESRGLMFHVRWRLPSQNISSCLNLFQKNKKISSDSREGISRWRVLSTWLSWAVQHIHTLNISLHGEHWLMVQPLTSCCFSSSLSLPGISLISCTKSPSRPLRGLVSWCRWVQRVHCSHWSCCRMQSVVLQTVVLLYEDI